MLNVFWPLMYKVYLAIPGGDEGRKQMASDPAEDSNPDWESRGSPKVLYPLLEESGKLRYHHLEPLVLRNILLIQLDIWKKLAGGW